MRKFLIISFLACFALGCSQFSHSPVSVGWHNLNAKFNSLVIARENMFIIERTLNGQKVGYTPFAAGTTNNNTSNTPNNNSTNPFSSTNAIASNPTFPTAPILEAQHVDYSQLMPILIPIDSVKSQALKANLDEVIKKTSMIAERHSNSKYLDEAYLLLGKARLYKGDYLNAIEIFKYINTNGKIASEKHAALIWLMRTYIEQKEYDVALKVSESLRLLDLNKENTLNFYITKAYLHELRGEYEISAAIAEEALKLTKENSLSARLHYATAQMYDLLEKPEQAIVHYYAIQKLHPEYDMEFYARMNMFLDEASTRRGNTASLENDFQQMLKNRKNKDLKDKIYFTMGNLEEKKGDYNKAVQYYQSSVKYSSSTGEQKSYSYLQLAELHYNQLQKYEAASAYYDSCLTVLPKKSTDYDRIYKRAISLSNFVKYQHIINTEDSLQHLAGLNPVALDKVFEKVMQDKEAEKQRNLEMIKKIAANNASSSDILDADDTFKRWELYDPVLVARNKVDFIQTWGNRALEDNWRRRDKEAGSISFKVERGTIEPKTASTSPTNSLNSPVTGIITKDDILATNAKAKKEFYDKIPTTPEKLGESNKRLEEAYYELGKIYRLQFNEPENAQKTFETLLSRFPSTQHESEVLYFLTLLDNNQSTLYRTSLLAKYPTSTYARQLLRGKVTITSDMESQANATYNQLFNLYTENQYETALKQADEGLIKFTGTSIEDKFAMLRILLLAKNAQKEQYTQALKEFTQSYPNSNLMKRAKEMLAVITKK